MALLTRDQAVSYAAAAGFTGDSLWTIVAIAQAESGFQTDILSPPNADSHLYADGTTHASRDRGILQISDYWWASYPDACVYDPACAFSAGYTISKQGTDFSDWSTFVSGAYRQYLPTGGNVVVLSNYPYVNQLDGSLNQNYNCVPASFASAIRYLDPGSTVTPSDLKNAEYGTTYTGGTSMARYVDDTSDLASQRYSVDAQSFTSSDMPTLTAKVHAWLQGGYPVLATIPSQWGSIFSLAQRSAGAIPTHVVAFYSEEGGLTAMNPWGAIKHTGTDAYWQARLCYNQVWRVYRISGGSSMLDVSMVGGWFGVDPDGQWRCKQTNQRVRGSVLTFYRTMGPATTLPYVGLPTTEEVSLPTTPATYQVFERGVLVYDPNHAYDSQPGCTNVYLAKDSDPQFNPAVKKAQDALESAQADLATANAKVTSLMGHVASLGNQVVTLQKQLADAQQQATQASQDQDQLAALQAQLAQAQADLSAGQAQLAQLQTESAKAMALVDAFKALL